MSPRTLLALGCLGGLLATSALAFSPGPPRPIPPNVTGVCSVGEPNDPSGTCGAQFNGCAEDGAVCLVDPAVETILAETRAVATLMVDEDVSGWLANSDASASRLDNARLTVLLEFQAQGKPAAISDTFVLDRTCDSIEDTDPSLCVPTWAQPISEANLIASAGEFQDLQLQWAIVNSNMQSALRTALLTPQQLAANPDALPLVEIVDGTVVGFGPFTAQQVAPLDQFDHSASAPLPGLASVRRLKVTIKVVIP
jgi:hypothetical protein